MIKNIFLVLVVVSFASILGSIYQNMVVEKRNSRWKFYTLALTCFLIVYFQYAGQEMTFAYVLKEISITMVVVFGVISAFLSTFLKGEKKAYGIISAGMTIPFSMTCLILSCFGVVHWIVPLIYFALPTIIFTILLACDAIKEKNMHNRYNIQA